MLVGGRAAGGEAASEPLSDVAQAGRVRGHEDRVNAHD
jgi:hypothetical protein